MMGDEHRMLWQAPLILSKLQDWYMLKLTTLLSIYLWYLLTRFRVAKVRFTGCLQLVFRPPSSKTRTPPWPH
jgi:hypothetical protein